MALGDIGMACISLVITSIIFGLLSVPIAWILSDGFSILSDTVPVYEFTRQTGDILSWLWVATFVLVGIVFWAISFLNVGKNRSTEPD